MLVVVITLVSADADSEIDYINGLIGITPWIPGYTYLRSANVFSSLPEAVSDDSYTAGQQNFGDGYTYLMAKYDGANGCALIWCVSSLSGDFTVPEKYTFNNREWQGNVIRLFNPTSVPSVPDGGSTILLMGMVLMGITFVRMRLAK
jgi:hypothetical protein